MRKQQGGTYIHIWFDEPIDHPYYVSGHVQKGEAQKVLNCQKLDVVVKSIKQRYGRLVRVGCNHEDAVDGFENIFRVRDEPRRSYYKVTECEPLLQPVTAPQTIARTNTSGSQVRI